jgi:tetratricopeptide (TPR) repeat protein
MRTWFAEAKQNDPENLTYLIQQAEFEDVLGNYDEAEKWLRTYMETSSVSSLQKAVVANNLAYMLALKGESDESLKLVDFAMNILGPTADLRDTLGMVHLANQKPVMALKEFEAAISDGGATAFKYVHVAMAQLFNGKKVQAAAAVKESVRKGLETFQLTKLEFENYRTMVDQLKEEGLLTDEDLKPRKK